MSNLSAEPLRNLPPTTLGVIAVCVSLHAIQATLGWDLRLVTMCPRLVLFTHEYYRVFTSAFFHANLMHIGMNMLSAAAISSALEKKLGTLRLFFSIWWAILLTSAIYILIAYISYSVFRYDAWMYDHAVGFSGILFHLSVLESRLNPGPRSLFGCFTVPASLYPWVLMLGLQIIMPNLSFLGHMAGVINGTLECYGVLDVLFIGDAFLVHLESLPVMRKLVALDSFVGTTYGSGLRLRAESSSSLSIVFQSIRKALSVVSKFVKDIIETILVRICGRNCLLTNFNFGFWRRRTDEIECGVIRPPEFYNERLHESDSTFDDEENQELAASEIV